MLPARASSEGAGEQHRQAAIVTPPAREEGGASVGTLFVGALGVVFGDIGTSPLYALRETFSAHGLPIDSAHVLGALSLIFWSIMALVSIKYVIIMMRADNKGEGGTLALLALLHRCVRDRPALLAMVGGVGVFAASLFYGDSMITPAISVLSAVEGLGVIAPQLNSFVVPLTMGILIVLFLVQRQGTASVGRAFGPVMMLWFASLAVMGLVNIVKAPGVLSALSPHHALLFLLGNGLTGYLVLGSVVLALTGAEALYADMGHFGRLPIRLAWYILVLPSLVLNYFGQGALLLTDPSAIENPFFRLVPERLGGALVILATMATVIASQAVISGAFSVTRQAIQLGYMPRMEIVHTSAHEKGQIYIPALNSLLMVMVLVLVVGFRSSSNLAGAYGVAVTGTMVIDSLLIALVMLLIWKWRRRWTFLAVGCFLTIDLAFFSANCDKIPEGGWLPLAVSLVVFTVLTTWKAGRARVAERLHRDSLSLETFLSSLSERCVRVPGTAIFFTSAAEDVPAALLHNIKHNKVVHERVVLLSVVVDEVPYIAEGERFESKAFDGNFHRVHLHFGFMERTDVPKTLANAKSSELGFLYEALRTSYFLSRDTVVPSDDSPMPRWRQSLFIWLRRNTPPAWRIYQLPINQVVELGGHLYL